MKFFLFFCLFFNGSNNPTLASPTSARWSHRRRSLIRHIQAKPRGNKLNARRAKNKNKNKILATHDHTKIRKQYKQVLFAARFGFCQTKKKISSSTAGGGRETRTDDEGRRINPKVKMCFCEFQGLTDETFQILTKKKKTLSIIQADLGVVNSFSRKTHKWGILNWKEKPVFIIWQIKLEELRPHHNLLHIRPSSPPNLETTPPPPHSASPFQDFLNPNSQLASLLLHSALRFIPGTFAWILEDEEEETSEGLRRLTQLDCRWLEKLFGHVKTRQSVHPQSHDQVF